MRSVALVGLALPISILVGLAFLPSTGGPLETFAANFKVLLHLVGALPKPRQASYGQRHPPAPRPANGSILEVQGFVDAATFHREYIYGEPVVFRGGASKDFDFDIECLQRGGKSVTEGLRDAMGERRVRIFKDQYDDASAEHMTFGEYLALGEQARNGSKPMPYARAFPQNSLQGCSPVPTEALKQYRTLSGYISQSVLPEPDTSLIFMSFAEGTNTKMHMDLSDTLFTQVYGRKKWTLIHRKYAPQMQIYADDLNLVYIAGYDVHREPVPSEVDVREVILHPGDVLYFAPMTLHAVYNLDPITIGVDNVAIDAVGGLKRHWLLALGTALNPNIMVEVAKMMWENSNFQISELYFRRFTKNKKAKDIADL